MFTVQGGARLFTLTLFTAALALAVAVPIAWVSFSKGLKTALSGPLAGLPRSARRDADPLVVLPLRDP
jgi:hypothetical protein